MFGIINDITSDPAVAVSYLIGLLMFVTIITVMLPSLKGDKLEARLKSVATRREQLRKQSRAALESPTLRRTEKGMMADVNKKLDLAKLLEDPNAKQKLMRAFHCHLSASCSCSFTYSSLPRTLLRNRN